MTTVDKAGQASAAQPEGMLERAREVRAQSGWRGVWFGALAVTAYRRLVIVERRLDRPVELLGHSPEVTTRLLEEADEHSFSALRRDVPPALFRNRLQRGEICVGAWRGDRLAAAGWLVVARAPIPYLERELTLLPGEAWAYDGFTDPALRSLGIGTARLTRLLQEASALGARRVLAALLPENRAAVATVSRTGWKPVGTLRALRPLGGSWRMLPATSVLRAESAHPLA